MTTRSIEVELNDMLDLVVSADAYGYGHSVLMTSLAEWIGSLTDAEIDAFGQGYLTPESRAAGWGEDDAEEAKDKLRSFRDRYMEAT